MLLLPLFFSSDLDQASMATAYGVISSPHIFTLIKHQKRWQFYTQRQTDRRTHARVHDCFKPPFFSLLSSNQASMAMAYGQIYPLTMKPLKVLGLLLQLSSSTTPSFPAAAFKLSWQEAGLQTRYLGEHFYKHGSRRGGLVLIGP